MSPTRKAPKVVVPPSRTNGTVSRVVELPDGTGRVEDFVSGRWVPSKVNVASVLKAPPASRAYLDRLGVPPDEDAAVDNEPEDNLRKLHFKSGTAFFEYQCKYGHIDIQPKQGIVALVLDSSKEFGTATPVKIEADGRQTAVLKVASEDGGFIVVAQTPGSGGDRLKPDDVVIWVPISEVKKNIPDNMDKRFGWFGFIVAKVKPEVDMTNPNFSITCQYG